MYKTDFAMRAQLPLKEVGFQEYWKKINLYSTLLLRNKKNGKRFILHDGPPYANGSLHIGHALNKILKDLIVRYKSLCGFYAPFVPGWDCHGLPIENKMLKDLQQEHTELSPVELRKQATIFAKQQVEIQKEQLRRFLLLSDLKQEYLTLEPNYVAKQLEIFRTMFEEGLVFQDLQPVFWSCSSLSALAEGEVEYYDKRSHSAYVLIEIIQGNHLVPKGSFAVIWTTQPWTLIANSAIALHPTTEYLLVEFEEQKLFFAKNCLEKMKKFLQKNAQNQNSKLNVVNEFLGHEVQGLVYQKPVLTGQAPVLVSNHVDAKSGSGIVHIAPAFGPEDFQLFKQHKLDFVMHVEDDGSINSEGGEYVGLKYWEADKSLWDNLQKTGKVLHWRDDFLHSYPHDWRTHKPIIFRATKQWFVNISKKKSQILEAVYGVKFKHEWEQKRLYNMLSNRESWTISRQRVWGVPIPVFYDQNNNVVNNSEIFDYVIALFRKEGSDCWFKFSTDELLPPKYRGNNFRKEMDIMDVWYDSGSSFYCANIVEEQPPFELIIEGSDQFRGWFNSTIINGVIMLKTSPYKELLTHGFVVDQKGNKMSKSKGNVVDPFDIITKHGAEILRLWVAQNDFGADVSISQEIIKQSEETYRKIRNVLRFLLTNLNSKEPSEVPLEGIHALERERFDRLIFEVGHFYEKYEFHNVLKTIKNYLNNLSSYYLSLSKDCIYVQPPNHPTKQQILYNFFFICDGLLKLLAPILPVTTEEAYSFLVKTNKKSSIHLESFPTISEVTDTFEQKWSEFFQLKDQVYKSIELGIKNGEYKRSAEVIVTIPQPSEFLGLLNLKELLMVGEVEFGSKLSVAKWKEAYKCTRCWNYSLKDFNLDLNLCLVCKEIVFG